MDTDQPLGYIMKMIVDRSETMFAQRAGHVECTAPQGRVLMYLESRDGGEPVSQRELEQYLGVSHTTVKGLLQRLEEKGFVRTAFDCEADGRIKHAYLTDYARRRHAELRLVLHDMEEEMFRGFSAEERVQLRATLRRVYSNILPLHKPHSEL